MQRLLSTTRDLVQKNAAEYSEIPFLIFYEEVVTYKDLDLRTNAFANYLLTHGIGKGDIVSFMMGNSPHFFYVLLGVQKIGGVSGPISCWWQVEEVLYLVNDSQPKVLVVDPEYTGIVSQIKDRMPSVQKIVINSLEPMELDFSHDYLYKIMDTYDHQLMENMMPAPDDPAEIMYTSGTTGQPKGVVLTHRGIISGSQAKTSPLPISNADVALCVLPLFHSGGLNDLAFPAIYAGGTIVLRRNFSASEFWECIEKYKVNFIYIVPTMWNILLRVPESKSVDTSSLKFGISGSAPIPPEQLRECEERFQIYMIEAYGATENTGGITANRMEKRKDGSVGLPFPGIEVKIVDENGEEPPRGTIGEIIVRGDTLMQGYFNKPEATAETIKNGWLYTGDMGYQDSDDFFFIVDRKKEMIIRGGVNVYPKEIESVIAVHPKVAITAVIPEPHDKYGQVARACIVAERGSDLTEAEIREHCTKRMASYKVPEIFQFLEFIPVGATGKIDKKALTRLLEEEKTSPAVPVAHFFKGMPKRFIPEKAKDIQGTISYNITGKGGGKWTITIKDQKMTLKKGILKNPTTYVVARDSDYHEVMTGKMDGITAVMTGKMIVDGDAGFLSHLRQVMLPLNAEKAY